MIGLDKACNRPIWLRGATIFDCQNSAKLLLARLLWPNWHAPSYSKSANPPADDDRFCAAGAKMASIGQVLRLWRKGAAPGTTLVCTNQAGQPGAMEIRSIKSIQAAAEAYCGFAWSIQVDGRNEEWHSVCPQAPIPLRERSCNGERDTTYSGPEIYHTSKHRQTQKNPHIVQAIEGTIEQHRGNMVQAM
jgi:hypothetical protein